MPKVLGVAPDGKRGQVDEKNVAEFIRRGGRLATPEEQTSAKLDAEYAAKSPGEKVLQAATWGGIGPKSEAYLAAGRRMLTGGISEAASKGVRDLIEPGAGRAYAKHLDELQAGHPIPTGAGSVAGLGVGVAMGGAGPFGALGELGAPVGEAASGAATALRASPRVAAAVGGGARGVIEGGVLGGVEHVAGSFTHDTEEDGTKLFSAIGSGALLGGGLGTALGLATHALASRAAGRMLSNGALPEAVPEEAPVAPRGPVGLDPDAGLHEKPGFTTEPIDIGKMKRSVWLHPDEEAIPGKLPSPIELENRATVDPNAGLAAPEEATSPFSFVNATRGSSRAARRAAVEAALHGDEPRVRLGQGGFGDLAPIETSTPEVRPFVGATVSPDAGLQELSDAGDSHVFDLSEHAHVKGTAKFRGAGNELAPVHTELPFTLEQPAAPAAPEPALDVAPAAGRPGGIIGGLADKYAPKLASKITSKAVRKIVSSAVGGILGHTVGGPVGSMVGMAAGGAVSDYATNALTRAGGVGAVLDGWGSRLNRAPRGVLDADAVNHLIDTQAGGEDAVVNSLGNEQVIAPNPRDEAQARAATANAIVRWLGDVRTNPALIQKQLENGALTVSRTAGPAAAAAYTASTMRAINFIAAHVPIKERRDPFDPRRLPTLNTDEQDRLIRAAKYAAQPWTVYDDFSRGRIYPEGVRAAKTFSPNEFARFQTELQEQVQNRVMRDPTLTQAQRLRLDKLLGYPAGATLQRTSITRLQQDMLAPPRASPVGPMGEGSAPLPPPANPPIRLTIDHSGFGDNIEARKASGG